MDHARDANASSSRASSIKPSSRSRWDSPSYSAYEYTSAMTSTSAVGRTPAAAGSVINSPVTHPPTNTTSSSNGSSNRAAASSNRRFGSSCIRSFSYAPYDLTLRKAPLPGATVPQCVHESQQFVEARIRLRGQGYCWKYVLCAVHEELLRRARVRSTTPAILEDQTRRHPPVARVRSTAPGVFEDQTRSLQPVEGGMNLGPAEQQGRGHACQS